MLCVGLALLLAENCRLLRERNVNTHGDKTALRFDWGENGTGEASQTFTGATPCEKAALAALPALPAPPMPGGYRRRPAEAQDWPGLFGRQRPADLPELRDQTCFLRRAGQNLIGF